MIKQRNDRNLKFKDGKWYVDFTYCGKRIRQFGGHTKEKARNTLAKMRLEKLDEKLGYKKPKLEDVTFEKFADDFLNDYAKPNKRSWQRDEFSLKRLKEFFKGDMLGEIGPEKVERFKAKRQADVSPSTVNRELACLKTLFSKAVEWGRLETNPISKVKKFREPNARERILSQDEARRLIECASPEIQPVLIVALNTGMRRNEILSLKWKDLDFVRDFLSIGDSKSGKGRKVPMNGAVREALKTIGRQAGTEFVFYNPGTKTHLMNIAGSFSSARTAAGLEGVRLHDLRHTAASKMIEAGVDLVTVSKILGHASIQMTMRYAHPTPENMKLAVEKLGEMLDPTRQKVDRMSVTVPTVQPANYSKYMN
jgi:integrase